MFVSLSGLHASPTKTHLILSKSAQHNRDRLLGMLGFQEAHLLILYLGLHLISSRLSLSDCRSLLLKIDSRIRGWGGVQFSFAARVQLIKSVLMSFNIYWAMAFTYLKELFGKLKNSCGISYGRGLRELDTRKSHGIKELYKGIVTPSRLVGFIMFSCKTSRFGQSMIKWDPGVGSSSLLLLATPSSPQQQGATQDLMPLAVAPAKRSPFSIQILAEALPQGIKIPSLTDYDETGDLEDHLDKFLAKVDMLDMCDAGYCKIFRTTLFGKTMAWFNQLPTNTIENFEQLSQRFLHDFSITKGIRRQHRICSQ
ncbi:hypothetical protein Sango_0097400 [Sesamum angolense]|uniref:Retrotransposon gag domain-containing protein n=1 Tax=Sesamum angolense TaxID=2727404 RepID=A0AAE1XEI4_9LAMI|nr:hypothetical protein Sango_0097400 [Sesamum angolense]